MMKYALALLAATVYGSDAALEDHELVDGMEVIGHEEVVTTYTTVEHIDILADDDCTECVYNDFVLVYQSDLINEWSHSVGEEYLLLMSDWERSIRHYEFETQVLNEDYWVKFRPLVERRKEICARRKTQMVSYVASNTYFHGASVHDVVPEVERFMTEQFNPAGHNIVSMFGLKHLTLTDATLNHAAPAFTFDFDEEEVVAYFREMNTRYDEVAAKYEQDWNSFVGKVNVAVQEYEAGVERVEGIYQSILRNAQDDAELYWDMHYDMPEGMEHNHDHLVNLA